MIIKECFHDDCLSLKLLWSPCSCRTLVSSLMNIPVPQSNDSLSLELPSGVVVKLCDFRTQQTRKSISNKAPSMAEYRSVVTQLVDLYTPLICLEHLKTEMHRRRTLVNQLDPMLFLRFVGVH